MDKIKVLIADDEILVREGLTQYIDWDAYNMEIIGAVESGEEVLSMLEENTVKLIISDICMPKMDGLELVENIRALEKEIFVILISGHSDFCYAQKAIKSKIVLDYILKPIDFEELDMVLADAQSRIENSVELPALSETEWEKYAFDENKSPIINATLSYIHEHYMENELSLNGLAESLFVSPNYLSNRFKVEMNVNFIKYVNSIRVKKAKELLKDVRLKVYMISEMVGFEDPRYFSRIFRMHTAYTPSQYQKKAST